MKNIVNKILESRTSGLISECQNVIEKTGEYHTYSWDDGEKKFKKGFLLSNINDSFMCVMGYNNIDEFENDVMGCEPGTYAELDILKVGDTTELTERGAEGVYTRIW